MTGLDFIKRAIRAGDFDDDVLRQIDNLVAEKVMGWKIGKVEPARGNCWILPNGEWYPVDWQSQPPYYSSIIGDAWVLWHWLEGYYNSDVALQSDDVNKGVFHLPSEEYLALAPSYEIAICLAALRAVGVDL